jgi:outer membrane lipoprotein-sorting protein
MMTRQIVFTVLLLLAFGRAAPATAQSEAATASPKKANGEESADAEAGAERIPPDPDRITWHVQALAHGPGGLNVTQFWSKGSRLRAETVIAGHKVVTLVSGEWYYAYDATKALGIRIRRTPEALALDLPYRRPFGNEAIRLVEQGAEIVGEEEFQGRAATIYRVTDGLGRRTVWASKDALNIPLRIEIYSRRTGQKQATDYLGWLTGLTIPDSFFEVDPQVEIKSYEFDEYGYFLAKSGSMGPVPVLYADLLRGW